MSKFKIGDYVQAIKRGYDDGVVHVHRVVEINRPYAPHQIRITWWGSSNPSYTHGLINQWVTAANFEHANEMVVMAIASRSPSDPTDG